MQQQSIIASTGLSAEDFGAFGSAFSDSGSHWIHRPVDLVPATPALAPDDEQAIRISGCRAELRQQADEPDAAALGERLKAVQAEAQDQQLGAKLQSHGHALKQSPDAMGMVQAERVDRAESPKQTQVARPRLTQDVATAATRHAADFATLAKLVGAELARVEHAARAEVTAARAQRQKLADELTRCEQALEQLQGALAKAKLELVARGQALMQSQAAQQQQAHELQTQSGTLAAAQQLAARGHTQIAELKRENELLLLLQQMHKVQE
jgi:hypothetical protein